MTAKVRYFAAAFALTVILMGAVAGFMAVDLSTDRYMPGQFSSMVELRSSEEGFSILIMGREYRIPAEFLQQASPLLHDFRAYIPIRPRIARELTLFALELLEKQGPGSALAGS